MPDTHPSVPAPARRMHPVQGGAAILALLLGALATTGATAQVGCPDPAGNGPALPLTAQQLTATTRDFAARYVAGDLTSGTCPDIIRRGYFYRNPSINVTLTGTSAGGSLSVNLRTNDDTCDPVLLVHAPNGEWYEDDDSGRGIGRIWDSLISVPAAQDGTYRMWLGHYHEGQTCDGALRLGYTGGGAAPGITYLAWERITSDQRQNAAQPDRMEPARGSGGTSFNPGAYDLYTGYTSDAGPSAPITNIQQTRVTLAPDHSYYAIPFAPNGVRFYEWNNPMFPGPDPGMAAVYYRNDDITTWRALCLLPADSPRSLCGPTGEPAAAALSTVAWDAITPNQTQFAAQPGGLNPIRGIVPGPLLTAGTYDLYTADAGPNGFAPYTNIRMFTVTLGSNRSYAADLGSTGVPITEQGSLQLSYGEPGPGQAMIYVRNGNPSIWRAICLLPAGTPRNAQCGTAGAAAPAATFAPWDAITNNPMQFAAQPGGLSPIRTVTPGPHFTAGTYDIYTADAGPNGLGPYTNIRLFTVMLGSNRSYSLDLGGTGLPIVEQGSLQLSFGEPGQGQAMIYVRNGNTQIWRAICVLPTGSPRGLCGA
ncbi:MAG: hypothetical protein KDK12_12450 [Rhodobacteraceae bacterium]|nr:hypothetical protein [Paracoccaceae bacterium]